jgi:hypothetical protein
LASSLAFSNIPDSELCFEDVLLLLVEELLLQELQGFVDKSFFCKLLKIPDMSGDLISFFASLRFYEESEEELSLSDSSEAVEVEEFLRTGSHSS